MNCVLSAVNDQFCWPFHSCQTLHKTLSWVLGLRIWRNTSVLHHT